MDKKQNILAIACEKNACSNGIDRLLNSYSDSELFDCFYRFIDFCLVKNIPGKEFFKTNFDKKTLNEHGVFVDKKWKAKNLRHCAVIGKSDITLNYEGWSVGRIYVSNNSRVEINAAGNCLLMVDAIDKSKVVVNTSENAKVIVNAYSKAEVVGNARIMHKNTETYDIQAGQY